MNHNANRAVFELLIRMGVSTRMSGFRYILDAVSLAADNSEDCQDYQNCLIDGIFPEIADKYHVSKAAVDVSIRHCVEDAYKKGDSVLIDKTVGKSYAKNQAPRAPTAARFLSSLILRVQNDFLDEIDESEEQS